MTAPLPLADRLQAAPHRFDGLHAIRLAELGPAPDHADAEPPGAIRITAETALSFAPSPVSRVTARAGGVEIRSAFLGLTGPLGVLPRVYSELIHRAGRLRNTSFPAFLDVFNHRLTTLFLQASEKYRLGILVQRSLVDWPARRTPETDSGRSAPIVSGDLHGRTPAAAPHASTADPRIGTDPVSRALLAMAGLGTPHLRNRMAVSDEVVLYYAGLFSARTRPAQSLEAMLGDYLGHPVTVEQFAGRWLAVAPSEQTRLPRPGETPQFCALGVDTVAGERVWDVQSAFRIVVGPVDTQGMLDLMPDQPALNRLVDLVRVFAGADLLFDVQVVLHRDSVPDLKMDTSESPSAPRLGWNTWAKSLPALDHKRDIILDPDVVARRNDAAADSPHRSPEKRPAQQGRPRNLSNGSFETAGETHVPATRPGSGAMGGTDRC